MEYKIKIVMGDKSEIVTVEAPTPEKAKTRSMFLTTLRARGQHVRFFNADTNEEIRGNF